MTRRKDLYEELLREAASVLDGERDAVVWMASLSCLIKQKLDFFWVGFYRLVDGNLLIGPYQGTLGCLRIELHKGVCGTAAAKQQTILVPDVHKFEGHIACDVRSQSEIVVPVFDKGQRLRAVLDIDSDKLHDFSSVDQHYLELLVTRMKDVEWTRGT
jgi:GAF domain-containing protein